MPTKNRLYLSSIVIGAVLLSVSSTLYAVTVMENDRCTAVESFRPAAVGDDSNLDLPGEPDLSTDCTNKPVGAGQSDFFEAVSFESYATPSSAFSATLHAKETNPSVGSAERRSGERALEAALKRTPLDLSTDGPHNDDGLVAESAEGLQFNENANCSTEIILAVFFKSRYCQSGTLIVTATSDLMGEANLKLSDYGSMHWDSEKQIWLIRVRNLETNPGTVLVVDGTECTVDTQVLTIPYGCDAKLYPDTTDDS